jgi:hypothetical protein
MFVRDPSSSRTASSSFALTWADLADLDDSEASSTDPGLHSNNNTATNNAEIIGYKELSDIYQTDFLNLDTSVRPSEFFAVREQVLAIETTLSSLPLVEEEVRQKVKYQLKEADFETKMGELGMILFYLERDGHLPQEKSLISFRALELEKEVSAYLRIHARNGGNRFIPSGKTHHLLHAFAYMIFTPCQIYNKGGLYALLRLLTQAKYGTAQYFQFEHLEHIRGIAEQMITNPAFDYLFKKKITVHPDLQEIIRLDLKLRPDAPIQSRDVFHACMIAFFFDMRQADESLNCYAIGSMIYAFENYTYKAFEKLIKWLEQGHFVLSDSMTLPISPLLERRLNWEVEMEITFLEASKALALAPFKKISEVLSLREVFICNETLPLKEILSRYLIVNKASYLQEYAGKLFGAFKYNCLILMQLAIIEFCELNSNSSYMTSSFQLLSQKALLVRNCISSALESITGKDRRSRERIELFENKLKSLLEEKLWLEPYCDDKCVKQKDRIVTTLLSIQNFSGDQEALMEILKCGVYVICLESRGASLILSYSELKEFMVKTIQETNQILSTGEDDFQEEERLFLNALQRSHFEHDLAEFAAKEIDMQGIQGYDLENANLLIFKQTGGFAEGVLPRVYQIQISEQRLHGHSTPYQFLESLLKELKIWDITLLKGARKVLMNSETHTWTLSPFCWKLLINNGGDFYNFIQENVFNPAKMLLNSKIPKQVMCRIIDRYALDEITLKKMHAFFERKKDLTYESFKTLLLQHIRPERLAEASKIIEEEFSKIELSLFDLKLVLKKVGVSLKPGGAERLHTQFVGLLSSPDDLANHLRFLLISRKAAIVDPFELEHAICKIKGLPLAIDLGDLRAR